MFARALVSHHQAQLLQDRARTMRHQPTPSEHRLWRELAGSKTGIPFRHQLVIGPYIVDFAAPKARLVVEVDGPYHSRRTHHDARRDAHLGDLGWRVIRVRDDEVFSMIDSVVERIREAGQPST